MWERGEVYTGFWWRNVRERDHFNDLGMDRMIIFFRKWDMGVCSGSNWIRTGTGEGTLVNAVINLQVP